MSEQDRLPKKNLTAKIVALVFAMILWVYVMNEQNPAVEIVIPTNLEVKSIESGLQVQDLPNVIRVKIRGPRNTVTAMAAKDVKAQVDLRDLSEGRHSVKVQVAVPPNVELVEITPDRLDLLLEGYGSRQAAIEGRIMGQLAPGTVIGNVTPEITAVRLSGLKSKLERVSRVIAQIDVAGKTGDFVAEVPLVAVQEDGGIVEGVQIQPPRAKVNVNIIQGLQLKLVDVRPDIQGVPADGFMVRSVSVKPEKIEVYGEAQRLAGVTAIATEPISVAGASGSLDREVVLVAEKGLIAKKDAVRVQVNIERKP